MTLEKYSLTILDSLPFWIISVTRDAEITDCNKRFAEDLKKKPEEIIGKKLGEVLACQQLKNHPNGCGTLGYCINQCHFRKFLKHIISGNKDQPFSEEIEFFQQGTQKAQSFKLHFMQTKKENEDIVLCIEDMRQKNISEKLKEQKIRTEGIMALIVSLAHEINNPLAIIKGLVDRIYRTKDLNQENLDKINTQVERITGLIKHLSNLTEIDLHSYTDDVPMLKVNDKGPSNKTR